MENIGLLVARLLLGLSFVAWGILKLRGGEAKLASVLSAMRLPDPKVLAYLVGVCELVGGLCVVAGYPVRTASVLLGLWCLVTGYDAHKGNTTEFLKNATMAGGFFALAAAGAGAISLFGGAPPAPFNLLP